MSGGCKAELWNVWRKKLRPCSFRAKDGSEYCGLHLYHEKRRTQIATLRTRIRNLESASRDVTWFDWSYNDEDAVAAIDALRALIEPAPSPASAEKRAQRVPQKSHKTGKVSRAAARRAVRRRKKLAPAARKEP